MTGVWGDECADSVEKNGRGNEIPQLGAISVVSRVKAGWLVRKTNSTISIIIGFSLLLLKISFTVG